MNLSSLFFFFIFVPGAWPHERSDIGHSFEKLNFLSFSLCVYIFKNCPSQFLSHWELAEPVFCSEELSLLPYKTKTKAWVSVLDKKFKISQFCCISRITYNRFYHRFTFNYASHHCFSHFHSRCLTSWKK